MGVSLLRWLALGAAIITITGCDGNNGEAKHRVVLKFAASVGNESARCGQMYSGLGTTGENAEVLDLRFYVSNIRLVNAGGEEVPLTLEQDGKWQVQNVALLDFEDGTGKCSDAGNADVNGEITGTVPDGSYNGILFDLGVPFDMNHDDLAAAPTPLNVSAMYWAWSIGYKFVRVDLETEAGLQWSVHVGSTMCESEGPADPPASECGRPNRPQIAFSSFDSDHDTIVFDLLTLYLASDLSQDTPDTAAGCQSFPDDVNECTPVFPNFGLDFTTGRCTEDCASQTVFRLRSIEESEVGMEAAISRGASTFSTPRLTVGGEVLACAGCHGNDGSGGLGPDIRPSALNHLLEHARDEGPHPGGVKFAVLTSADFDDLAAYLSSVCESDPGCEPQTVEGGHHE